MGQDATTLYAGLDVHKATISVTTAAEGREGPVTFIRTIPNTPADIAKLAKRLVKDGARLHFCDEAGGCGYGIHRQLTELGHACAVVATSRIDSLYPGLMASGVDSRSRQQPRPTPT
jgi:transposase